MKLINKESGILGIYLRERNTQKHKKIRLLSSVICFFIAFIFITFLVINRSNLTLTQTNWAYLLIGTWVVMAYVRVTEYIDIDVIAGFIDKKKIEAYLSEKNVSIPEEKMMKTDFITLIPSFPIGLSIIYVVAFFIAT